MYISVYIKQHKAHFIELAFNRCHLIVLKSLINDLFVWHKGNIPLQIVDKTSMLKKLSPSPHKRSTTTTCLIS